MIKKIYSRKISNLILNQQSVFRNTVIFLADFIANTGNFQEAIKISLFFQSV